MVLDFIDEMYRSNKITTDDGVTRDLDKSILPRESGQFIYDIVASDPSVLTTLEVGCAFGLSSLWIAAGLSGRAAAHHTIIDPFEMEAWKGAGLSALRQVGFDRFSFFEEGSEIVMSRLLTEERRFDLIFVDGAHYFDQALVDCYFATRLLRTNGYLIIDNTDFAAVSLALAHFSTYPCYILHNAIVAPPPARGWKARLAKRLIPKSAMPYMSHYVRHTILPQFSIAALKKISEDEREWTWHVNF